MINSFDSGNLTRLFNVIEKNKSGLGRTLEKIASGRRLNRAGEDAASSAIATRLRSDIRVLTQAVRNVDSGANFVRTAEGGLQNISNLLSRGRELAIQASNGTLGDPERKILNQELTQIKTEIDRISSVSEFNGQKLLDGSLSPQSPTQIDIQAGSGSGPENRINLNVVDATDTQTLNIDNTDISTQAEALSAIADFEQAGDTITATRGEIGATSNRLVISGNDLGTRIENLTRSESQLADADLAKEISDLQRGLTLFKTSIQTLATSLQQNERATGRLLNTSI